MLTVLVVTVGAVIVLVLALLVIVVLGIRQEPPNKEFSIQAPSLFAAMVRRLLGVYVRKPDPHLDERHGEPCLSCTRRARR
jgi:hypothetical protein